MDSLWNAANASEWSGHFVWTGRPPRPIPLLGLLTNITLSRMAISKIPRFTKALCSSLLELALLDSIHGLVLLDLKDLERRRLVTRSKIYKALGQLRIESSLEAADTS